MVWKRVCCTYRVGFFIQAHGVHTEGDVVYVPFPLDCKYGEYPEEKRNYMKAIMLDNIARTTKVYIHLTLTVCNETCILTTC